MNWKYKLRSFGYAEIGDDIWFPNLFYNALIRLKKATGRIEIIGKFPNYEIDHGWLYSGVCHVDKYLVFIPNQSKEIVSYDMNSKKFVSTALDLDHIGNKKTYFVSAYVHGHYVYMFPTGAMCMVRYNIRDHSVKYLDNDLSALIHTMPKTSYCLYQQFEILEEKIYFPFLELNAVAVFSPKDESIEIKYLDVEGGCSTINYAGGFFYLASWNRPEIYRWNIDTGEVRTYPVFPKEIVGGHIFLCACNIGDTLVYFPEQSDILISFSTKTGKLRKLQSVSYDDEEPIKTYFAQKEGKTYHILTADRKFINCFFYESEQFHIEPLFQLDDLYNEKKIDDFWMLQKYYAGHPEGEDTLKEYMDLLIRKEESGVMKEKIAFGEEIFRQLQKDYTK